MQLKYHDRQINDRSVYSHVKMNHRIYVNTNGGSQYIFKNNTCIITSLLLE